jgi:hypothetical protein
MKANASFFTFYTNYNVPVAKTYEFLFFASKNLFLLTTLCYDMEPYLELDNPCGRKREFCRNCSSLFMTVRPFIKNAVVHKKFFIDLGRDKKRVDSVVKMILDCQNLEFHELHKFEKSFDETLVFRAKQEKIHFVYCVNKKKMETMLFLRAINNFTDYKRLLENEQQIKKWQQN